MPLATIRRERSLPVPGAVTVRVNESVQAQNVVAEAEMASQHLYLDIARGLGVPEHEVPRHLVRERGERVEADDILAGPVGLARRSVRAPSDGRIVGISGGRVLFEAKGEPLEVHAGFPGQVLSTDGSTRTVVETTGALIQAVWGNGRRAFGVMRVAVAGRDGRLDNAQLDINLRGAVLVAGICDHPSPLERVADLSVRGLVLGGLTSDLIPFVRRLEYPVVVIDGFGDLPMNPVAYNLLESNEGREVSVDGSLSSPYGSQRPEVIIPLPASHEVDLPDELVALTPGVRVRVLRKPYLGFVGVVRSVLAEAIRYPSGILARSVEVDLDAGEVVLVPIANLEVLQ